MEEKRSAYRYWVLALFLACSVTSFVDRQAVALLLGPLKHSLGVSDTELGLLQGATFTFVYATAGIGLGTLADMGNRVRIIVVSILGWSIATISCGFASSFSGLLAGRAATAIGEAGLPPSALSALNDIFRPNEVMRAGSIMFLGNSIGAGLGLTLTAALLEILRPFDGSSLPLIGTFEAWKGVFIIIGLPGLLLALLVGLTVKEPVRRELTSRQERTRDRISWRETFEFYRRRRDIFLPLALTMATVGICIYGQLAWFPAYVIRSFGVSSTMTGLVTGPVYAVCGLLGGITAGRLVGEVPPEHILERVSRILYIVAFAWLVPAIAMVCIPMLWPAIILFGINVFLLSMMIVLLPPLLTTIVPNRMRARTTMVFNFFGVNIAGLAPFAIGALTDHFWHDEKLVGASIAMVCGTAASITGLLVLFVHRSAMRRGSPDLMAY